MSSEQQRCSIARVLIVEDHPLVRLGLSHALASHPRFCKCGEADNAAEAWSLAERTLPDAAIVDLTLAAGTGLEFIKKLSHHRPSVQIIVSSMHDSSIYETRCKEAGAFAYIPKESGIDTLLAALEEAVFYSFGKSHGGAGGRATSKLQGGVTDKLTDRELEVFRLIGKGMATRQIARRQNKSIKTIESYRAKIKKKIGATTSEELARDAVRWVFEYDAA